MKRIFVLIPLFALFGVIALQAQKEKNPNQSVKGNIINVANRFPVESATLRLVGTNFGATSNSAGAYIIKNAPVGRYQLRASIVGYEPQTVAIVVSSGKEVVVNFELLEKVTETKEVNVTTGRENSVAINSAAIVSSTQFTVDDASRFAGSLGDPARMAQNFAGVLGANDQRNDIIIRGGSPTELLWRLDNLDIPNPNHFATAGSTGGPISALNTNLLSNSDFLTGAFPAEYGDKMSGVFDLKTRKGNRDKYEYMGQFGFNGFEFGAEGPTKFADGSFIVNYRYSFLGLLEKMGVSFGFAGIPKYQDATLKGDFKLNDKSHLSITGLWGTSSIDIRESETDDVATGSQDTKNATDILALALNLQTLFSEKVYGNFTLGFSSSTYNADLDSITTDANYKVTSKDKWYSAHSSESFADAKYVINYSPEVAHQFSLGFTSRYRFYNLKEDRFTIDQESGRFFKIRADGSAMQYLGFVNWNWRITDELTTNIGLHSQYFALSNKSSIEPRAGMSWNFMPNQRFTLGFGVHSQSLPLATYFQDEQNKDLDFMQAIHYIAGYTYNLSEDSYAKIEGYYKDISKAPVESAASSYSFLNSGANFGKVFVGDSLISKGLGRTYGVEFSYIKNFTSGYYITGTASLVRQEYKASDGVWRWGAFDNKYIFNILAGYEWKVKSDLTIEFSGKYTLAGGAPYTPVDVVKSAQRNETYYDNTKEYTLRKPDYSRLDFKIDFRQNHDGWSLISFVSVENILNRDNVLAYVWDNKNNKVKQANQLGFYPMGGIKIEF